MISVSLKKNSSIDWTDLEAQTANYLSRKKTTTGILLFNEANRRIDAFTNFGLRGYIQRLVERLNKQHPGNHSRILVQSGIKSCL